MAYRPSSYQPHDARDAQFNMKAKQLTSQDYAFDSVGEEDEEDCSEEEPWWGRRALLLSLGVVVSLCVVVAFFVHAFGAGGSRPAPPETPALPLSPAPTAAPPVVVVGTAPPFVTLQPTPNPLLPQEKMHDHNLCLDNEELYAGLCYQRCGLLTDGTHPLRTSSWTCCASRPCGLSNQKGEVGTRIICQGYDVDGAGHCPHEPGACLVNEEMFLGRCYMNCSILTEGQFPNRVGPATCCMTKGMGCFNVLKDRTSPAYNTGGGAGDHDVSTPRDPHPPIADLTEAGGVSFSTAAPLALPPGFAGYVAAGTRCAPDEELYAGLCYATCSILTSGTHPIRTSSWTCCANEPCGLSNQKGSVGKTVACNGYDIGGSGSSTVAGLTCPHAPSGCGKDEESFLGVCYDSCAALTQGRFPYRVLPMTCCKEADVKACLDISKTATSLSYDVGRL